MPPSGLVDQPSGFRLHLLGSVVYNRPRSPVSGPQEWSRVRYWLLDLAEEVQAATKVGSLPAALSLDRVWIMANGPPAGEIARHESCSAPRAAPRGVLFRQTSPRDRPENWPSGLPQRFPAAGQG